MDHGDIDRPFTHDTTLHYLPPTDKTAFIKVDIFSGLMLNWEGWA